MPKYTQSEIELLIPTRILYEFSFALSTYRVIHNPNKIMQIYERKRGKRGRPKWVFIKAHDGTPVYSQSDALDIILNYLNLPVVR